MGKLSGKDGGQHSVETCLVEDGGIYLLIVDGSLEFRAALKAASSFAALHKARIGLLFVIEPSDFQQWGSVESQIMIEERRKAEDVVLEAGQVLYEFCGQRASFFICEGELQDVVVRVLEKNNDVKALVLGAGPSSNPLISYFSGKGLSSLSVPLFIIPNLS